MCGHSANQWMDMQTTDLTQKCHDSELTVVSNMKALMSVFNLLYQQMHIIS